MSQCHGVGEGGVGVVKLLVTGGSGLVGRYVVEELSREHAVNVIDLKAPERKSISFVEADVLDLPKLKQIVRGYDAVVHLAGIPHPLEEPAEKVFRVNTLGTFNVLEACVSGGVGTLVFMSSESTLGFAFSTTRLIPAYFPIDEDHRLRPQDPYGLSKVASELLCRGYSERIGIKTICLRAPWIWVPEPKERVFYRQLINDYTRWPKNLWAFIHVRDVAQAIRLALSANLEQNHNAFFITADENWTGKESLTLAKEFFPEVSEIKAGFSGTASFINSKKAKTMLGFRPSLQVADVFA